MSDRRLFLLSAYRLPTHYPVSLESNEMAAWLTGYLSLWHPALVRLAVAPPEAASTYDHDPPTTGHVYCLPETHTAVMAEDWFSRAVATGALPYRAVPDRPATIRNLAEAVREGGYSEDDPHLRALLELPPERLAPFYGIGFGYAMIQALFEAMSHDPLLDTAAFWESVTKAAEELTRPDSHEAVETHLREAAQRLREAREQLYYITIYLLDFCAVEGPPADRDWPAGLTEGFPLNVIATGETWERLAREYPGRIAELREHLGRDDPDRAVTICGGVYRERDDAVLPVESQFWNFRRGREATVEALGRPPEVFARLTSAYHPQLPTMLQQEGMRRAVAWALDGAVVPSYYSPVVHWPGPDGKAIDIFTRPALPAHEVETFFNLASKMNECLGHDNYPTLSLLHRGEPASDYYRDWLELSKLGPVLGEWTPLRRYFDDAMAGDYSGPSGADDFFCDYLDQRVSDSRPDPVSGFARQARRRRQLDTAWSLAALHRSLGGDPLDVERESLRRLADFEDRAELGEESIPGLEELEVALAKRLADRLQSRSAENTPGFLLLNPCSYPRRLALELEGIAGPLPISGAIKAGQFDPDAARLVVEVPALGFAWIPARGQAGTPQPVPRMTTAEGTIVRNEFFEADVDPATGGLRAMRDLRTRVNRLGEMLVYQPGSRMRATSVEVTRSGAALGEITSVGEIVNDDDLVLARFRQRFRAWMGRPVLDVRIELTPERHPKGYAWHAYFGARFAWRDDRAAILRGSNGQAMHTTHTRPVSPEFAEIRLGSQSTTIFTGGLPFLQRHGARMIDVILIPEGETATAFDLAVALDRDNPAQVAQGMVTPAVVVPTEKGPPHVGPSGWLAHLDATNLLITSLRPDTTPGSERAVIARMEEVTNYGGMAEFRFVRDPSTATLLDGRDGLGLHVNGDAVPLEFSAGEMLHVRVGFS